MGDGLILHAPVGKGLDPFKTNSYLKSFNDHIIRNENEYLRAWEYIDENPLKGEADEYFTHL